MPIEAPTRVKHAVKSMARRLGVDVRRLSPASNASYALTQRIERLGIDLVLDVGANVGQFGRELREAGYPGRIVSFEPLPDAHARLLQAAEGDPRWDVHARTALGDEDGELEINIAGNSASSSVLPMTEAHASAAEHSRYIGRTRTPVRRLDAVAASYLAGAAGVALKIDTQGYEWQVLGGGAETLARTSVILCELSLVPLYEGQQLWMAVIARLEAAGFTLWSLHPAFSDPRDGRTLQVDGVFVRGG